MMLPYGALHHVWIHARWSLPLLARAGAPKARGLGRRLARLCPNRPEIRP